MSLVECSKWNWSGEQEKGKSLFDRTGNNCEDWNSQRWAQRHEGGMIKSAFYKLVSKCQQDVK